MEIDLVATSEARSRGSNTSGVCMLAGVVVKLSIVMPEAELM